MFLSLFSNEARVHRGRLPNVLGELARDVRNRSGKKKKKKKKEVNKPWVSRLTFEYSVYRRG